MLESLSYVGAVATAMTRAMGSSPRALASLGLRPWGGRDALVQGRCIPDGVSGRDNQWRACCWGDFGHPRVPERRARCSGIGRGKRTSSTRHAPAAYNGIIVDTTLTFSSSTLTVRSWWPEMASSRGVSVTAGQDGQPGELNTTYRGLCLLLWQRDSLAARRPALPIETQRCKCHLSRPWRHAHRPAACLATPGS